VLPYHRTLCTKWAEVTVAAQAFGRRIDCADAWIAATALHAGSPLIVPTTSECDTDHAFARLVLTPVKTFICSSPGVLQCPIQRVVEAES
jgi:predicted nucleic acid-binding protein